jgi:hypothetical protein
MVCELVAASIVPDDRPDDLALPRAFRAAIVPQAVIDRRLALCVEHPGCREPVQYRWKVSAGEILGADEREAVWKLPAEPGAYLAQVAVCDRDSAAVAILRWRVGV